MNLPAKLRPSYRKMLPVIGLATALLSIAFNMLTLRAASPNAGDLMLLVSGGATSNTTGSVVEINTTNASQSAVQTIPLPDTTNATDSYRMSASATSTGYVALSNDRTLLAVTGHNSTNTSANANTLNPRGVYTIDAFGTVVKQTTYTGVSGNQTRGATTLNDTSWFIADQGGLYTNGSASASPTGNFRAAKAFGGTVYIGQTSSSLIQVATISAASGGTATGLPGLTSNANFTDFYLVQSGSNGTAYDVLYVVSDTSATAGTIAKYSLVSGSWVANGTYATNFGGFGLAAAASSPGATLYVTTGTGASAANSVIKVVDVAGYNAAINVTTANNVTLYTTAAGTVIKSLDFAPQAVAVAPSISQSPQSQTIGFGQTATLTVAASGTATLNYQWYQGAAGDTTTPVGTNSSSFTTPALTATTSYWVRVSNSQGSADSSAATITVTAAVAPSISTNPQSQTIAAGQTATLTVGASGTAPLTYQWYRGTASDTTTPVGTNAFSFITPALTATTSYWVRVSNAGGSADSTTAVISVPSAFGNLTLLVAAASASNTTASLVKIDTTTPAQSASQTVTLPGTGSPDSYRMSGSATSTGYVSLSDDRSLLTVTGANSTDTSDNVNTLNPRGVYTLDASGMVVKQTTYTGASGNQTRSATSLNDTAWYIGDQGGLYTNGSTSASPSLNARSLRSFGGTVYAFTASSSSPPVGVIATPTGSTFAALPGLPNGTSSMQDFYMVRSGTNGTAYDVLYILSATSGSAGTIAKYSLVSGLWTANGTYTTTFGGFGLAAAANGTGADLYVSTGTGATTNNNVIKATDGAGYNAAINVTTASNVTLYTAAGGAIVKGLDFSPQPAAPAAPSISQNPQSQTVAFGQTTTLTVVASGAATLSYQWYQGAASDTSMPVGTNSSLFTTPALTVTTSYWVRVSNSQGSADSATATISVNAAAAPSISTNPQSQSIPSGQTVTLTVAASGPAPLSYQWYQGTASVTTTPVGTNAPSFTTPALTATTSYWVRVSNPGGSADSTTAVITVTAVSTPPSGTGAAVLPIVPAGGTTQLTVTVTPGTNPASTNIAVTADLSTIGGSNTQAFTGSGNTFSFTATVAAATTLGAKSLPVMVSDAQGRGSGFNISLTVTAPLASSPIVISQIYGGGGNSGALYTNDYVQLYNRGNTTVDTSGWSLQYAPATGTGDWTGRQPLGGTIAPGQYYLIALASGGATGSPLPPANVVGAINISQTTGKLALTDNGDLLTGTAGCPVSTHIQDLVGYGSTADCWEGTGAATVSGTLAAAALFRAGAGTIDTNDNKADFSTASPNPFTTAPIVQIPPQVFATYPTTSDTDIPLDATIEVTFTQTVTVDPAWFDITCATTASHNSATEAPDGLNHWITPNTNFAMGEQCTVTVFKTKVHDAATGLLSPPQDFLWTFTVVSGAPPPETPDVHLLMGNPTGAVTDVSQPDNYLMSKPQYALSYNRDLGRPNWVSWHLTNAWIPLSHPARVDTFRPDPAVPPDWYRVQSFDFSGSGFDRGHMSPNADREDTLPDNQATFLMSNMVVQSPDNNEGPWADFENYLRSVVRSSTPNEIYIVSGPVGTGGAGSNGAMNTVASGHVTVPAFTWKVALVLPDNGTENNDISRVNCSTTTVAVIMPNIQGIISNPWTNYLTTVSAVESLTGYHFFTNLPQPIQNCIKAGTNGVNPKNDQTIAFAPIAGATVGDVIPLQAAASSGLPVTLSVISGPAMIVNGTMLQVTGAGMVTVQATQAGDVNYNAAPPVSQMFLVSPANQTITFGGPAPNLVYGAPAFQVSATGGASGNPVTISTTGACSAVSQPGLATITVVSAGTCNVTASQAGNANYNAAPNASETILIARAAATINVSGGTFVYDGNPHGLSGTASGIFGEDLSSLLHLGATFLNAPGGHALWAFDGNIDYLPSSGSADVTITQAGAAAVAFIPGNLVVAVEGNGVPGAASGPFTDNQAGPLTLFQFAPNGTASAAYVNSLVLPQTGSGANLAVSGEYGSSSEGTLHLSGSGQYLTIAGYGINAAAYNANPALYGTDPAKPTALAQSGSLSGAGYTPVPRVLTLIDPYGNVNSSTALYNVFNTNNPRSTFTNDGVNFYVSGQGTGNDLTAGIFYTTLGSSSATAITGATAASNSPPPTTIAQDTDDVQIVGGQLYASIDSKEGTGSNRDFVGTLGPAGAPPSALVGAPVRLPGFGNNGGTGKVTITAATTNGINSIGQEINLGPVNFFFANSTTLYVADSGQPKNDSVTNDSNGVTLGNGGLQKWVLNSGTWSLQYTLGLQNGLPLVPNTAAAGPTGLYGLTGKVVGGEVLLYATTYSKNDLDPTFLFGFTDVLAATTNPGTSFTQLAAAPADSNFKGVAFAPAAPSGGVTITSSPSGMAFTSAGSGCAPGSYTTPVTLIWTPGAACTVSAASPQAGAAGIEYQFHQWEDGSLSQTRSVIAPSSPAVYNVAFDTYYQLTTSAGAGGTVSAGGFFLAGTDAAITATPALGNGFINWTGNVANANSASTTITMNAPQSVTANFQALITPVITWPQPADIVYGTALSAAQLDPTVTVKGSFSYTPPAGTVLNAGSGQTIMVTFTPDDTSTYTTATFTVTINVLKANPVVTEAGGTFGYDSNPHPATGTVTGVNGENLGAPSFTYTPGGSSTPVNAGSYTATAAFAGNANYNAASTNTASITIAKAPSSTVVGCAAGPFLYTGSAITPCSASVTGIGLSQSVPVTYTNNINAGTASAVAAYVGDIDHNSSSGSLNFTIRPVTATITLSGLAQAYNGAPKPVTAVVNPLSCGVGVTYNGSATAPTFPGVYAVVASVTNANCSGSVNGTLTISVTGLVHHAPTLNSGAVHGSLQVLLPESFTVNGSTDVTGDLLVPGTPTVKLNGKPTYAGTIDGTGSASPSGQTITLNGSVTVNHIVRRTDPVVMPAVSAPPAAKGTRDVSLNSAGQDPGSFSTIRNLTLNGNVGQVAVPPGTYGNFTANGGSGFTLGVAGATTPSVYNFQQLVINGNAQIVIAGPVVITVANGVTFNGAAGAQAHPEWLSLAVYSGGVTLNGNVTFYGYVAAPTGSVIINGDTALHGGVTADSLTLNGGGLLDLIPQ